MSARRSRRLKVALARGTFVLVVSSLMASAAASAADRVYWSSFVSSGEIRVGNLNGAGTPADVFATTESAPYGVAIDPAAGKIYWANNNSGKIRVGNLNGGGTPADLFPSTAENPPVVAVVPPAAKSFWPNYYSGKIRVGNLNGGGTPADLFPSTTENNPFFLALLRAPVGLAPPTVSGGAGAGSRLSCSRGSWAGDLVGAFLYRAPRSFFAY